MTEQVKVRVINRGREYEYWVPAGQDLWTVLATNNWSIDDFCGGRGICGKCRVKVEGKVSEISVAEQEKLSQDEIEQGIRLACYCRIYGETTVYLNESISFVTKENLSYDKIEDIKSDDKVEILSFFIPGLDSEKPVPIYDRLNSALKDYSLKLSTENINELSLLDRAGRPLIELEALAFETREIKQIKKQIDKVYGIAMDLGTTSLFAALVDLLEGKVIGVSSKTNMQRIYGADIISRVSYCLEKSEGLEKLHQILINNINSMIEEFMERWHISPDQIYRFTAVGNPVMLHFLINLSIKGFSKAPYMGLFSQEMNWNAYNLGINANPEAELIILPQIGGFIGADTIGCLLSLEPEVPESFLLIDIGTNGEIVLGWKGEMWAASAAAGPAFEGGNITCGGRAGPGSIDKFYLDGEENLCFSFMGQGLIKNICGSAVIDLAACLLDAGYIDEKGIITTKAEERLKIFKNDKRGKEIVICDDINKVKNVPVVFNQEDIRQVQLAKSAVRTAIDVLIDKSGAEIDELEYIFLAGTFGSFLNPQNCIRIGLLPAVDLKKVKNIGNAAAKGAIRALLSSEMRNKARKIKEEINYVELALEPDFKDRFIKNLNF
ncbi:ASKHA domain-containing protein [Thermosyntropha sp.]|uniref:ASKHA domain-containing protein n=1 Tax=Thermosyntropha sp. TaxID=2740820 RepID=UPI0025D32ADE|nr:ASKHA domain-containing protein [Thermosyntropha sp.]MBO8159125.1 DUF4445 domain-containing protein [Thermosyntropha sp.]